ncbi:hypothetical protein PG984_000383 [Apiospora sp. TS-2023a]
MRTEGSSLNRLGNNSSSSRRNPNAIAKNQVHDDPKFTSLYQLLIVVGFTQTATTTAQSSSATLSLKADDIAPEDLLLCPFKLVRQYPYKFVGTMNRQKVQDFFMDCIFESGGWNIRAPLLLIPTTEIEGFLQYVNRELRVLLTIPTGKEAEKFSLRFSGCPRPQFAGKVASKDAYDALKNKLAQSSPNNLNLHPAALSSFKDKMDKIYESVKTPKVKKDPAVQRARIIAKQKSFGQTTKRVQRYLGLRTRTAYSVGIAILDTQDIVDLSPGESGRNWFNKIQAHHLRVAEVAHVVNSRFVQGCPDDFDFGESEIIPRKYIVGRIENIIGTGRNNESSVVMVGHDLPSDMKYLKGLGFNLWNSPLFLDEADTKNMFQRVRRDPSGRKLAVMCNELGIPGRHFHNAGNDAMYTLRAMIAMAVLRKTGYPEVVSTTDNPREIPR